MNDQDVIAVHFVVNRIVDGVQPDSDIKRRQE